MKGLFNLKSPSIRVHFIEENIMGKSTLKNIAFPATTYLDLELSYPKDASKSMIIALENGMTVDAEMDVIVLKDNVYSFAGKAKIQGDISGECGPKSGFVRYNE